MLTVTNLIAEIRSELEKLSDAGRIDDNDIYKAVVVGLRRLGGNIMERHEKMIEVKSSQATLPDNFYSLYLAVLCEPHEYENHKHHEHDHEDCDQAEQHSLYSSRIYKERTSTSSEWRECDASCATVTERVIKENVYFENKKVGEFRWKHPRLLRLGKGFIRNTNCNTRCRNLAIKDNPDTINISGKILQANFSKGGVYIQYDGIPTDEDDQIVIPETPNGTVETYITYFVKSKIFEKLVANGDNVSVDMFKFYMDKANYEFENAKNELKMNSLSAINLLRMSRQGRLRGLQYEIGYSGLIR